jgi:hypothetical protein
MKKLYLITLTCLVTLCAPGLAARAPIDLSNTAWTLEGSLNVNLQRIDRFKLNGQVDFTFDASTFTVVDNQGDGFQGDFVISGKKTALTPDSATLQTYLENKIQKIAAEAQITITTNAITDITAKLSAKPKSGKNELGLTINITLAAKADIQADGHDVMVKLKINLKGKGTLPLPPAATHWFFDETKLKANVVGIGGLKDVGTLDLTLGPLDAVAANNFLAVDDQNNIFTGTFDFDEKGVATITGNPAEFEAFLAQFAEAEIEGASNVTVTITDMKITAKIKAGVSIKLSVKIKFDIEGMVDGEFGESRGGYTLAGTGCPI